jgi:hypothetical protein
MVRRLLVIVLAVIMPLAGFSQERFRSGVFLHHSTGENIWGPNGSATSIPLEIAGYNNLHGYSGSDAISMNQLWWPSGSSNEWEYWHRIFENKDLANADIRPILTANKIVVIKSCFPSSGMSGRGTPADTLNPTLKSVYNYKWHWRHIVKVMKQHPENFFAIWTSAPMTAGQSNATEAGFSKSFCKWAKDTLAAGLDPVTGTFPRNIYVFDYFAKVTDISGFLLTQYAVSYYDSHPNSAATALIAPQFVNEIFNAAISYETPATPPSNVALNKTASCQSNEAGREAWKANDSDATNASFWSAYPYPRWWMVDLGDNYDITSVVIRNYVWNSRYYLYNIESSLDGINYTRIAQKTNTNPATNAGDSITVSTTARYLRVNMTYNSANNGVHISDFKAYGVLNTVIPKVYALTASAGAGGTISPSGIVSVSDGGSQSYTITPASYYQISDVLVDGVSVGAISAYTFTNVKANHTITATFSALPNLALNKPATSQSVDGANVASRANDSDGTNASFWATYPYPRWWMVDLGDNYDVSSVIIRNYVWNSRYYLYNIEASLDGINYTRIAQKTNTNPATDAGDKYTVSTTARYLRVNMTYNSANTGVHITDFRVYGVLNTVIPKVYAITSSAGAGGTISPSGIVSVSDGGSQSYTITPASYYQISDVLVDGVSVGVVSSYTFTNVKANHTITATFSALPNIALNKTATSQSVDGANVASRANDSDGTNASFWATYPYPRWWMVDLGDNYDITSLIIRNYVWNSRYYLYNIEASLDGINYTRIAQKTNINQATDAGDNYTVSTTARYLRVNMTYNSANTGVHITDFRVYGVLNTVIPKVYAITGSAGAGGTISPSGIVSVSDGGSQSYTITPASYYQVSDVLVDGVSVGAVTAYTFTNVKANHTITATFSALPNIALNKPATSQSVDGANVASRANDSDGTNASFWAAYPYPRWWMVDLGDNYAITSVVIRNYVWNSRYYQYNIESSLDGITFTRIAEKTNTTPATDAGDAYDISVTARYLRVNLTYNSANSGVHISDFRVYGTLSQSGSKGLATDNPMDKSASKESNATETENTEIRLKVYPNPFSSQFSIRVESQEDEVFDMIVSDPRGRVMITKNEIRSNTDVVINERLNQGFYILRLTSKKHSIIRKIICR